jgi:hypothetical protein
MPVMHCNQTETRVVVVQPRLAGVLPLGLLLLFVSLNRSGRSHVAMQPEFTLQADLLQTTFAAQYCNSRLTTSAETTIFSLPQSKGGGALSS